MSSLPRNSRNNNGKSVVCKRPSTLGSGTFGTVIKCSIDKVSSHPGLQTVAVKISTKQLKSNAQLEAFSDEKELGIALKHPNVVEVYDDIIIGSILDSDYNIKTVLDQFRNTPDANRIIMEYCDEGDLYRIIQNLKKQDYYSPDTVTSIYNSLYYGIGSAIRFLHKNGVVHNDIKEENIYVKTDSSNHRKFILKLADFGKSYEIADDKDSPYTATIPVIGTALYAPLYFLKIHEIETSKGKNIFLQNPDTYSLPVNKNKKYYIRWFIDWYCFICVLYYITNGVELTEQLTDNGVIYVKYNQLASLTTDSKFNGFGILLERLKEIEYNLIEGYLSNNNNKKDVFDDITNYKLDSAFMEKLNISLADIRPRFLTADEINTESRTNNVIIPNRRNSNSLRVVSGKTTSKSKNNNTRLTNATKRRKLSFARNSLTRKRKPSTKPNILHITS